MRIPAPTPLAPAMLALAPLALLGACGSATSPTPAATPTVSPTGAAAKVEALPPGQKTGVMLRAIRDAGQNCQQVENVTRVTNAGGPPSWIATCDGRQRWVVVIADDGTATVANANDVGKH